MDEAITVQQAGRQLPDIIKDMALGVHPPLYHVLVHFWMAAFGQTEVAVRSFSVLVGVAAIPVAYWAGSRIFDRRTGLIASMLVALSPFQIWYSQEARMYELLFLAGLLSTAFLVLSLRDGRPRYWIGYFFWTAVGLFTHYFFVFLLASQIAFYVFGELVPRERDLRRDGSAKASIRRPFGLFADVESLGPWLGSMIVLGTLLAAWLVNSVFANVASSDNALLGAATGSALGYGQEPAHFALRFNDLAGVIVQMTAGVHSAAVMSALAASWPLLIYLTFLLLQFVGPVTRWAGLLLCGVAAIAVMMLIGQWQGQILASRYFMAVAGPAYLLVARVLAGLKPRAARPLLAVLAIVAVLAWADQSYDPSNAMRYDNREALGIVAHSWRTSDTVLYVPFYLDPITGYYLPQSIPSYGFPQYGLFGKLRASKAQIDEDLSRIVGPSPRVWLFLSFQNIRALRADTYLVRSWLEHNGYRVTLSRSLSNVVLMRFDRVSRLKLPAPKAEAPTVPTVTGIGHDRLASRGRP